MKPNINSVEVHPQLSNNRHPVDGVLVGASSLHYDPFTQCPWPHHTPIVHMISMGIVLCYGNLKCGPSLAPGLHKFDRLPPSCVWSVSTIISGWNSYFGDGFCPLLLGIVMAKLVTRGFINNINYGIGYKDGYINDNPYGIWISRSFDKGPTLDSNGLVNNFWLSVNKS